MIKYLLRNQIVLLAVMMAAMLPCGVMAHDFEVDGIFYKKFGTRQAVVTYKGDNYDSKAYSGKIVIPEEVTYEGTTYSVTSIADYAFWECRSVTSVTIPNSIVSINPWAFGYCSFTSITIPASVTRIADLAFCDCSLLREYKVDSKNPQYKSFDGAIYDSSLSKLLFVPSARVNELKFPASLTILGDYAFYACRALTSFSIPEGVSEVGKMAFLECTSLASISFPKSLTSIYANSFFGCPALKEFIVDTDNPKWKSIDGVVYTADATKLALVPRGLENEFVVPDWVESIGAYAFYDCESLTSITIPRSVTSIGSAAFLECQSLKKVICLNPEPPELSNLLMKDLDVTLYVPEGSVDAYSQDEFWADSFTEILEYKSDGIENLASDSGKISFRRDGDGIVVSAPANEIITVFNAAGQLVYHGVGPRVSLAAEGVYIFRVGNNAFKVVH